MEAEDIIEVFNKLLDANRKARDIKATGRLIVHRQILPHKTIKSLLDIFVNVYFVTESSKELVLVARHRLPSGADVNKAMAEAIKDMTYQLMSLIGTHTFNQLVTDNFYAKENS